MNGMEGRKRLSDDAHFELSMAAVSHERRSRPRGVLIAAGAAVLLAAFFAGYGLNARNAARADLTKVMREQTEVEILATQWVQLEAIERDPATGRIGRPVPDMITQMERLATQRAGLSSLRQPRTQQEVQRGGIVLRKYHYGEENNRITSPTIGPLIEWLRLAVSEQGMEIESLNLKPDANNWGMTVTFHRLERPN